MLIKTAALVVLTLLVLVVPLSCSMSVVSSDQATFLVMGAVGSSHEATTIPSAVQAVQGSGSSVEMIMNGTMHTVPQRRQPTGRSDDSISCDNSNQPLQWAQQDGSPPPSDWLALQCAGKQRESVLVCCCLATCMLSGDGVGALPKSMSIYLT
jgi:hypothetical protein